MTTENRIVGPGWYPRRPTKRWMCMSPTVDVPNHQWYGWVEYDVRDSQREFGIDAYVFVLAKSEGDAKDRGQYLNALTGRHWVDNYISLIEPSFNHSHFQACLDGRSLVLHWPDGSWCHYLGRVAQAKQGMIK